MTLTRRRDESENGVARSKENKGEIRLTPDGGESGRKRSQGEQNKMRRNGGKDRVTHTDTDTHTYFSNVQGKVNCGTLFRISSSLYDEGNFCDIQAGLVLPPPPPPAALPPAAPPPHTSTPAVAEGSLCGAGLVYSTAEKNQVRLG